MSFYVTLPSNSSNNNENTQANYTTYLNTPLVLNGRFEVALSEICFSGGFKVNLGSMKFVNPMYNLYAHRTEFIEFEMTIKNGISIEEFKEKLNEKLQTAFITIEFLDRYKLWHLNLSDNVIQISKILSIEKEKSIENNIKPILEVYSLEGLYVIIDDLYSPFKALYEAASGIYQGGCKWTFEDKQFYEILKSKFEIIFFECPKEFTNSDIKYLKSKMTNLKNEFLELEKENLPFFNNGVDIIAFIPNKSPLIYCTGFFKAIFFKNESIEPIYKNTVFKVESKINIINYILLYTDIIEDQYYGQQMSQILRVIPLNSNSNKTIETFFENPHYARVRETLINSINIEIRDLFGDPIQFSDFFSYVIVKLHFRKQIL